MTMAEDVNPRDEAAILSRARDLASRDEFRVSQHAREEMSDESITTSEVLDSIQDGRILENYPEHQRGPCCLLYGHSREGRDLHVVVTTGLEKLLIITVYAPGLPWWQSPTTRAERRTERRTDDDSQGGENP